MGGALLCDSGGLRSMHVDELACSADELGRAGLPAQLPVLCLRHGWRSSRFDVICNAPSRHSPAIAMKGASASVKRCFALG
jgi:hypothetical protein